MTHSHSHPVLADAHDHGHSHPAHPVAPGRKPETPAFSLLRASLAVRLAVALALSSLIWLAVYAVLAVPA